MGNMNEIWKDIPGWEGMYQVSNMGHIRSMPREWLHRGRCSLWLPGKEIQVRGHYRGYMRFDMHRDGKRTTMYVHEAVASAFLGKRPDAMAVVNHRNGDKGENRIENLEWATRSENIQHYYANVQDDF